LCHRRSFLLRVVACLTSFSAMITIVKVVVLSSFWICLLHPSQSSFDFFRVFLSPLRGFPSHFIYDLFYCHYVKSIHLWYSNLILNYDLRVMLIILLSVVSILLKMKFRVGWKLMLNYALLLNLPFICLKQIFCIYETCSEVWKQDYCKPTILNVFIVYVKIFLMLFLPDVLILQWQNIWVKFIFFVILMSYCLMPLLLLKN